MRYLVAALAAFAFVGGLGSAQAALPMMYEITPKAQANKVLAELIDESLKSDPSGNSVIRGSACTTPLHFFAAIRAYHPSSKISTVGELPAFLHALQLRVEPPGTFRLTRMVMRKNKSCDLDLAGWERPLRVGEGVWVDPNTQKIILAGDCTNVVEIPKPALPPSLVSKVNGRLCEGYRKLVVHMWDLSQVRDKALRDEIHAYVQKVQERARNKDVFKEESFARKYGGILRRLEREGAAKHSTRVVRATVTLFQGDADTGITQEVLLGDVSFKEGKWERQFEEQQALTYTIRIVIRDTPGLLSPVLDSLTKEQEIRFLSAEWGKQCVMNTHALIGVFTTL